MATIQGIYLALFGRPADPEGLAFWMEQTNDGQDLTNLIGALTASEEYQTLHAGKTNTEIVNSIYQALFGRPAEPDGLAFFLNMLAEGTATFETIAINILDGARDEDVTVISNKIEAANLFTASLDTPAEIEAYVGDAAAEIARQFIENVTGDPQTVPTQDQVDEAVTEVVTPGGGQEPGTPPGGGGGGGGDPDPDFGTPDNSYGNLQATHADNELYVGGGNPADGFFISYNEKAELELGLDVRFSGSATEVAPTDEANAKFVVPVDEAHSLRFAWSAAQLGGEPLDLDTYDIKLKLVDENGTEHVLTLGDDTVEGTHENNSDSAYDWYDSDNNPAFVDDGGNESVTQNIQKLNWTDFSYSAGETYQVTLEATVKGTDTVIASTSVNIEYEAVPGETVVDFDGSDPNQATTVPANAVDGIYWIQDRTLPESFTSGDGVISLNINEAGMVATNFAQADTDGRSVPYYSYQGMKLRDIDGPNLDLSVNEHQSVSISFDFDIKKEWATDHHGQSISFWPFVEKTGGATFWPIIDYIDADAAAALQTRGDYGNTELKAGFRLWNSDTGAWEHFTPTDADGVVNLNLLIEHDQLTWQVTQGDTVILDVTQKGAYELTSEALQSFGFQGLNFGHDETYQIDNLIVGTVTNTVEIV